MEKTAMRSAIATNTSLIIQSRFRVVNSSTFDKQRNFALSKAVDLLEQPEFDNAKPTVVYMHGFVETMEVESIRVIAEAYMKRADHSKSSSSYFR
jgi:hypothetical protein